MIFHVSVAAKAPGEEVSSLAVKLMQDTLVSGARNKLIVQQTLLLSEELSRPRAGPAAAAAAPAPSAWAARRRFFVTTTDPSVAPESQTKFPSTAVSAPGANCATGGPKASKKVRMSKF